MTVLIAARACFHCKSAGVTFYWYDMQLAISDDYRGDAFWRLRDVLKQSSGVCACGCALRSPLRSSEHSQFVNARLAVLYEQLMLPL